MTTCVGGGGDGGMVGQVLVLVDLYLTTQSGLTDCAGLATSIRVISQRYNCSQLCNELTQLTRRMLTDHHGVITV